MLLYQKIDWSTNATVTAVSDGVEDTLEFGVGIDGALPLLGFAECHVSGAVTAKPGDLYNNLTISGSTQVNLEPNQGVRLYVRRTGGNNSGSTVEYRSQHIRITQVHSHN